jgi:hypothetical protein
VLALLQAGVLAAGLDRLRGWRLARPALAGVLVLLVAEPLASAIGHDRIAARVDTRVEAPRWLAAHLPPGASVEVLGTHLWTYGQPQMPRGMMLRHVKPDLETLRAAGIRWVVTHDHPLPFSDLPPEVVENLLPHLRLVVEFDPFTEARDEAIFETADAYYIPFHGFRGVNRPGPLIRIYEVP